MLVNFLQTNQSKWDCQSDNSDSFTHRNTFNKLCPDNTYEQHQHSPQPKQQRNNKITSNESLTCDQQFGVNIWKGDMIRKHWSLTFQMESALKLPGIQLAGAFSLEDVSSTTSDFWLGACSSADSSKTRSISAIQATIAINPTKVPITKAIRLLDIAINA